ncbi:MAG: cell envelope integrity protein TolA [Burkholderiales bacterium]|nr:cell envelope integrity protein TolA [Burkholderiales bacterium]
MRPPARSEPRSTVSLALSVGVHVLLIAVLFFAISWKTKPPAPVVAELWTPPEAPRIAPRPEPAQVEPTPAPKPEPKVEPKPPPKPDIALEREKEIKRLEEVERKRQEDERKRLELEKKKRLEEAQRREEAERKRKEDEARAKAERDKQERAAEEQRLKKELESMRSQRLSDQLARELGSASPAARTGTPMPGTPGAAAATAAWVDKIRAKIKGNVVLPPEFSGNPEAEFLVQQLPSGDIVSVKLARSSGSKALDDAWERAILKSSPLPQPDNRDVFQAALRLKFRPTEAQ